MKRILITAGIVLNLSLVFGQSQFEVKTLGTSYSQNQIESALNNADLCGFHYIDDRRLLTFDDGSTVELGSSLEVSNLGVECFIEKHPSHDDEYWEISNNGHLIRRIKTTQGKQ